MSDIIITDPKPFSNIPNNLSNDSTIYPTVYIVAEHCGVALKDYLITESAKLGINIIDLYPVNDPSDDYPTIAKILAHQLKKDFDNGLNSIAIAMCGSGQGINMCLNRFYFVRSALISSEALAVQAREHGNSNVITFGANYIEKSEALKCLIVFVQTQSIANSRHSNRVKMFSTEEYTRLD